MTRLLRLAAAVSTLALASTGVASAYGWPIRPFDRQHPVRGFFGDPRTVFARGVLTGGVDGPGFFSFHQGVDISAPDGTPVYPVANGIVHYLDATTLRVGLGNRIFQYFHIIPVVREGQFVVAQETILGYVKSPFAHVHLTEIDGTRAVNPLQSGHLSPYVDDTRPTIRDALFEHSAGLLAAPLNLCGRVKIAVDAFDTPPMPAPGSFRGLPVAPALVRWSIVNPTGTFVVPWRTAADFRFTLPANKRFFDVYMEGTYQNAPRFGNRQYASMPGRYLFLLDPDLDTASLPNGAYTLEVIAADERGNQTLFEQQFSILNSRGNICSGSSPERTARASDERSRG